MLPLSTVRRFRFSAIQCKPLSSQPIHSYADKIRNVGIVAHIDAGKTTTTETMLYLCGEIKQLGRVDTGDTYMDFLPLERERGITISSATTQMKWKNNIVNVIDTPGHVDFTFEVARSARVLDGCVVIIDAGAGVQAQTQTVWKQTVGNKMNGTDNGLPAIAFVNKMDRSGADFERSLKSMKIKLNANIVPIQYPLGSEEHFTGVIDLIGMNKIEWSAQATSRTPVSPDVSPLSADFGKLNEKNQQLYQLALKKRAEMWSILAENDEQFLDKYLQEDERLSALLVGDVDHGPSLISIDDVLNALSRLCRSGVIVPTLCGASLRGKGVEPLLDSIGMFLPPPTYVANSNPQIISDLSGASSGLKSKASSHRMCLVHKNDQTKRRYIKPIPMGDMVALVFKLVHDPNRGVMAFVRVFSGSLTSKSMIHNSSKGIRERVNQLCRIQADDLTMLEEIQAGDVGCIIGLKNTVTGDTIICPSADSNEPKSRNQSPITEYILDGMTVPDPVYSLSIEPEKSSEQPALEKALSILALEDPSVRVQVSAESGMIMLSGLGELHLEIVIDKLQRNFGLVVETGKAYVGYRETLSVSESFEEQWIYDKTLGTKHLYSNMQFNVLATQEGSYSAAPVWSMTADCRSSLGHVCPGSTAADVLNAITESFQNSFKNGPGGYPITGVSIQLHSITSHPDCTPGSLRAGIASFVNKLFNDSSLYVKLEPIMLLEVEVPQQFVGTVLNDLCVKRRATMREVINADDANPTSRSDSTGGIQSLTQVIVGEVPLDCMLGYSTVIRSMTQGEGLFSMEYSHHAPVM